MKTATAPEYAIRLHEVTKRFGGKAAVQGLSLEIRAGEIFAFLGPNGAGKTTTIKMIVGLLGCDQGSVTVCGHLMGTNGVAARARVAYVPDQPFLYEKLSGREFLDFVGQMYRVPLDVTRARVAQLADRLLMEGSLDRLCETYSHGMKQKLVLASALLHDPEVLVVDEPMVGLDPRTARVVKDLFVERSREGRTVFMSTHTLSVAEVVATRIGIIHRGRLVAEGTVQDIHAAVGHADSLEAVFLELTSDSVESSVEGLPGGGSGND
jgi:ABC-2 type transport system ATP-binding protein